MIVLSFLSFKHFESLLKRLINFSSTEISFERIDCGQGSLKGILVVLYKALPEAFKSCVISAKTDYLEVRPYR